MASSRRLLVSLWISVCSLLVLVIVITKQLGVDRTPKEQRVASILREYEARGLFVDDVLGEGKFTVPNSFRFPFGLTQAQRQHRTLEDATIAWKRKQYSWGLLTGLEERKSPD